MQVTVLVLAYLVIGTFVLVQLRTSVLEDQRSKYAPGLRQRLIRLEQGIMSASLLRRCGLIIAILPAWPLFLGYELEGRLRQVVERL